MDSLRQIAGVVITELRQIQSNQGYILHMLRNDAPEFTGFGECYFSEVLPGAIKAWKCHHNQTQNLAVPIGRVHLVIYDNKEKSISRGIIQELELGRPDAYWRVQIPKGLWYGFSCVGAIPALISNCPDLPHDPEESLTLPVNDASIPYKWVNT